MRSGAGVLRKGSMIVEATAGNTGVGLALIGVNRWIMQGGAVCSRSSLPRRSAYLMRVRWVRR